MFSTSSVLILRAGVEVEDALLVTLLRFLEVVVIASSISEPRATSCASSSFAVDPLVYANRESDERVTLRGVATGCEMLPKSFDVSLEILEARIVAWPMLMFPQY